MNELRPELGQLGKEDQDFYNECWNRAEASRRENEYRILRETPTPPKPTRVYNPNTLGGRTIV